MTSLCISDKQRQFLEAVANEEKNGLPLYVNFRTMASEFDGDDERQRFLNDLATCGLIDLSSSIRGFARLTEKGRAALAAAR